VAARLACIVLLAQALPAAEKPPRADAYRQGPMTADQTCAFARQLAQFIFDNHLKKNPRSQQRGMIYEYLDMSHLGYIPCGINSWGFWDRVSDSGGYAHLVSAAAQWLLYLDQKNDWELHNYPAWE